jgi:putative transposase
MKVVSRKVEYRMYPNTPQEAALFNMLGLHQRLYNAALEQRITAWRSTRMSVSYVQQAADLTELRTADTTYADINAQSEQVTLKRLDRAFKAFFARCKTGKTPGFPRFKNFDRYSGWGYAAHGDGFRFIPGDGNRHGILRLSGVGEIKLRGRARTLGEISTCEIHRKAGRWYASITVRCIPKRKSGFSAAGHDWGISSFATYAYEDGSFEEVANPRFFAKHKNSVERAQRHLDAVTIKDSIGRLLNGKDPKRVAAKHALGRAKQHEANCRKDFLHQESSRDIAENCILVTEKIQVKNMTKSAKGTVEKPGKNVAQKAGLNREILATAPATYNRMRKYKAEEAGAWYIETPTRKLKPTQRCSGCWELPKKKKSLSDRTHHCLFCGLILGRDRNAARVNLLWAFMMLNAAFSLGQELAGNTIPIVFQTWVA